MVWFIMTALGFGFMIGGFRIDNMYMFIVGGQYFMTGIIIYELRAMREDKRYDR